MHIIISMNIQWQWTGVVESFSIPFVDTKRACLAACADWAATRVTERLSILNSMEDGDLMRGDGIGNWLAVQGQLL